MALKTSPGTIVVGAPMSGQIVNLIFARRATLSFSWDGDAQTTGEADFGSAAVLDTSPPVLINEGAPAYIALTAAEIAALAGADTFLPALRQFIMSKWPPP